MRRLLLILTLLLCISNNAAAQNTAQKPIYFPLKTGNEWVYTSTQYARYSSGNPQQVLQPLRQETVTFKIRTNTSLSQKKYFTLHNSRDSSNWYIRFDPKNGDYYLITLTDGNYSTEKLFMKNNVNDSTSWVSGDFTYHVVTVSADLTIGGTFYKNVCIVDEVFHDEKLDMDIFNRYWYAENIGLISFYLSYPFSNIDSDIKYELSGYPAGR